jgi:hypothetical protein
MNSLHHLIAQVRMEEMRQQAERARRAHDLDTARTSSAPRHTRARTWAARLWSHPAATGTGTAARTGEAPR